MQKLKQLIKSIYQSAFGYEVIQKLEVVLEDEIRIYRVRLFAKCFWYNRFISEGFCNSDSEVTALISKWAMVYNTSIEREIA